MASASIDVASTVPAFIWNITIITRRTVITFRIAQTIALPTTRVIIQLQYQEICQMYQRCKVIEIKNFNITDGKITSVVRFLSTK